MQRIQIHIWYINNRNFKNPCLTRKCKRSQVQLVSTCFCMPNEWVSRESAYLPKLEVPELNVNNMCIKTLWTKEIFELAGCGWKKKTFCIHWNMKCVVCGKHNGTMMLILLHKNVIKGLIRILISTATLTPNTSFKRL